MKYRRSALALTESAGSPRARTELACSAAARASARARLLFIDRHPCRRRERLGVEIAVIRLFDLEHGVRERCALREVRGLEQPVGLPRVRRALAEVEQQPAQLDAGTHRAELERRPAS